MNDRPAAGLAVCDDHHSVANVVAPVVGRHRAEEIATLLLEHVDLLLIAKEDAAYFQHLGLEPEAIAALTAAFDLNVRLAEARFVSQMDFGSAEEAAAFLVQRFRIHDREIFGALFFDLGNQLISAEELFEGSGFACAVDVRVLMRRALLLSSASLLLWHSQPSGSTTPSQPDIELTTRIAQAGKHLGVRLLDHLVLAPDGRFTSMRRERCW